MRMDCCSWRHHERSLRSLLRSATPLVVGRRPDSSILRKWSQTCLSLGDAMYTSTRRYELIGNPDAESPQSTTPGDSGSQL